MAATAVALDEAWGDSFGTSLETTKPVASVSSRIAAPDEPVVAEYGEVASVALDPAPRSEVGGVETPLPRESETLKAILVELYAIRREQSRRCTIYLLFGTVALSVVICYLDRICFRLRGSGPLLQTVGRRWEEEWT